MNIFIYEFVTGGGLFFDESLAAGDTDSLAAEGRAMLTALAEDFLAIDGVSVTVLQDKQKRGQDSFSCRPTQCLLLLYYYYQITSSTNF